MISKDEIRSCGVLVMRRQPSLAFLLMVHRHRLDLPKGHVEPGETDFECAMRELEEETGISSADIEIDDEFRHEVTYMVRTKRGLRPKRVVFFLGWLHENVEIQVTEHPDYRWCEWSPPHKIQAETVDGLLHAAEEFLGDL
jgi:bis(5'-nucleosidyl)-tetraphosphatase